MIPIVLACLFALAVTTPTHAEPLPQSVLLFELAKERIPPMQYNNMPYGGLSLCKLLERQGLPQPFFALPMDVHPSSPVGVGTIARVVDGISTLMPVPPPDQCDLSKVILAYGGWCTAGVEDSSQGGPHFSQPLLPSVELVSYDHGWTVIYLSHYLKSHTKRTKAGRDAAAKFFQAMPAHLDVRSAGVALFPAEYLNHLPPKARP